jgi:hypothetical protein
MDTVVVRVFRRPSATMSTGVFFQTQHAPVILDALTPIVNSAHRRRLLVFVWMSAREANWKLRTSPGWADLRYDSLKRAVVPSGKLDLFQEAPRDYIKSLYRDLARYPIDGIIIDDDSFSGRNEGLSPYALEEFYRDFGEKFSPVILQQHALPRANGVFWRWSGWKSRRSFSHINSLIGVAREVNPNLQFGILLSDKTILDPVEALGDSAQDLLEAKRHALNYYIISVDPPPPKEISLLPTENAEGHLPRIAREARKLMGHGDQILLKINLREGGQEWMTQLLKPIADIDPTVLQIFSETGGPPGRVPLEILFTPRSPGSSKDNSPS